MRKTLFLGSLLSILSASWWHWSELRTREILKKEFISAVGQNGLNLFSQYDIDEDGYLSMLEFEPVIHRLLNIKVSHKYNFDILPDDETFTVWPEFQPLLLNSMSKSSDEYQELQTNSADSLDGLKKWKTVAIEGMDFAAKHFKSFLPLEAKSETSVGVPYLLWDIQKYHALLGILPPNNRYHPPKVDADQAIFYTLLSMFHPRPFLLTRFGPHGAVACVRAYNDQYLDIVFRMHAEFQLNEPPLQPFWFTPAYFSGNLIINRNATSVLYFNLAVPNHNKLNVDMEWLTDDSSDQENMMVDIGYMPQMELKSMTPSRKLHEKMPPSSADSHEVFEQILINTEKPSLSWKEEITTDKAMDKLNVNMFPFKEVPYYNFTTAFKKAKEEKKLVHSIILWGVLDDQSC